MTRADVKQQILAANQEAAFRLRHEFHQHGVLVVDLISSPGSGKTTLLERTADHLSDRLRLGAIVGDITTEMDAERLRSAGLPAYQIGTGGTCHLDARMVEPALEHTPFPDLDVLFIENVGNLICPTSYDLGEDAKVALLSVTEGHDKPFKYPGIFSKARVVVVTKTDLLPHVAFDMDAVCAQVRALNAEAALCKTSIQGEGMDSWCRVLQDMLTAKRSAPATV